MLKCPELKESVLRQISCNCQQPKDRKYNTIPQIEIEEGKVYSRKEFNNRTGRRLKQSSTRFSTVFAKID